MIKVSKEKISERIGVESFEETVLHKALQRVPPISVSGPWIAGGAVRRTLEGRKLDSDWDFFFNTQQQLEKFGDDLRVLGGKLVKKNDKNEAWILPASVPEDTEGEGKFLPEMKIQLIAFQYYESAEKVIDSFDFTICQFAYDGTSIYMGDFSLWDVSRKKLVPHKITYATASVRRLLKYANQGYTVCGGAISELLQQVANTPSIIESSTLYID